MSKDTNEAALQPDDFDELDAILDALREQDEDAPQWEFCEGFMAALICSRRVIMPSEYLPVLFGEQQFADEQQAARFMRLWMQRWNEIATALNKEDIEGLDDEAAYHPEVLDVRGSLAAMPPEERAAFEDEAIPSFGQVWALGFLAAVDHWSEDWAAPRDKESAEWLQEALAAIEELAEADPGEPEIAPFGEGPPSVSEERIAQFGDAIWAVYDLRQLWRSLGPRVEPVRRDAEPGRNDLCPCGSGKKYKKCHGAQ